MRVGSPRNRPERERGSRPFSCSIAPMERINGGEFRRHGSEDAPTAGQGGKVEHPGVEEEAGGGGAAVAGVAHDGQAESGAVDANLIGTAGDGDGFEEDAFPGAGENAEAGFGGGAAGADVPLGGAGGVAADGEGHRLLVPGNGSGDEGEIAFFDGALGEHAGERGVGREALGGEQDAGGAAVEAMKEVRFAVAEAAEGVVDRAGPLAAGGVDEHAGGLVDGDQVIVFIKDFEGNVFGRNLDEPGGGVEGNLGARSETEAGGADKAVDAAGSGGEGAAEAFPGDVGETFAEETLQADRRIDTPFAGKGSGRVTLNFRGSLI